MRPKRKRVRLVYKYKLKRLNKAERDFYRLLFAVSPMLTVRMYKIECLFNP